MHPAGTKTLASVSRVGRARPFFVFGIETITILIAAVFAFLLRFDFRLPERYTSVLYTSALVWVPVKLASFKLMGLDRRSARYISLSDLMRLCLSNVIGTAISLLVLLGVNAGVPKSVYAIDLLLCVVLTAGFRISIRMATEATHASKSPVRKRTLIYGAGDAGLLLLRDLHHQPALNYEVIGFIDDDSAKTGFVIHGVKVFGGGDDLRRIVPKYAAELVLIAMPSATGAQMKQILARCNTAGVPYKTIPSLAEMVDHSGLARQLRDVAVEDLLGRTPVNLEHDRISASLRGRTVLVTGAAGSIGSELCRQLARFDPAAIVGYDVAESPLFHLSLELQRSFSCPFHPEIGSIGNVPRMREVFERHRPSVVYHAAAYKHVPLMESHIFEAVENNVFGTLNLVQTARELSVTELVMISSDKAVRPASIMGATKRLAELIVRSLQLEGAKYVSVRFGNVLGSNGSVVPIFKDQIARGGPVTVTDPEMRRYFMTIPEACQLVLQASTMGKGGEIFVLDMGEPVRIVDLATNLIMLSGLRPDVDIRIEFTGARPGEKLFEQLNEDAEGLARTHHEKIRIFEGATRPWPELESYLRSLRHCCVARSQEEAVIRMAEIVPEYRPAPELLRSATAAAVEKARYETV